MNALRNRDTAIAEPSAAELVEKALAGKIENNPDLPCRGALKRREKLLAERRRRAKHLGTLLESGSAGDRGTIVAITAWLVDGAGQAWHARRAKIQAERSVIIRRKAASAAGSEMAKWQAKCEQLAASDDPGPKFAAALLKLRDLRKKVEGYTSADLLRDERRLAELTAAEMKLVEEMTSPDNID